LPWPGSALGQRLHLRRHLEGLRPRRLRRGRLRPGSARPRTGGGSRLTVGWRVSRAATAGFVLDALEQAIHQRRPAKSAGLVAHSDRGSQYLAIRYTERLAEAGIAPSVGSVGDSYDNALAETVIGLFKTEVIRRRGPWRSLEAVEFATLEWVDWFDHRRLLEPIGRIPPAEAEAAFHAQMDATNEAA
jgi:transposase InsO family protein